MSCPPIDKLLDEPFAADVRAHVSECEACGAIAALAELASEDCATVEPWLAASLEHPLPAAERGRLFRHLVQCEPCRQLADTLVGERDSRAWRWETTDVALAHTGVGRGSRRTIMETTERRIIPTLAWATSLALLVGVACGALLMKAAAPVESPVIAAGSVASASPHQDSAAGGATDDARVSALEARIAVLEDKLREKERFTPKGTLEVSCVPACDRIEIDGVVAGASPLPPQALSPGEHVVVLERKGTKARRTVVIQEGQTAKLRVVLEPPRPRSSPPVVADVPYY